MMYRNGQRLRTVVLTDEDMRAMVDGTLSDRATEAVRCHLDGPPDSVLDAVDEAVADGLSFRRDAAQIRLDGSRVVLEVCPDGDVDDEGRPIDCTSVSATWLVGDQRVEFELDEEWEVIEQWSQEERVGRR